MHIFTQRSHQSLLVQLLGPREMFVQLLGHRSLFVQFSLPVIATVEGSPRLHS